MESVNNPREVENLDTTEESYSDEPTKKRAKSTSDCWKFFTDLGMGDDGIERAECKACKQKYKVGGELYGTSDLNYHISVCKAIKFQDVGQMMIGTQEKFKSQLIDHMVSREMCAAAIIEHELPFNFVEYKKIRSLIQYLDPDAIPISRNAIESSVLNIHMREKEKLKQVMTSIPNRICLTFDLWTSCTTEGYICLTAHFVDNNWKLNSKILNFCHMPPPYTGFDLATKVFEFLGDWGIEKKIFSLTLDNSSAGDNMQDILKNNLGTSGWLLNDGEFFHVHCSAHILNLIVQEGLKVASDVLHKIRESVKYVKGSEARMKTFQECVAQLSLESIGNGKGLRLDVPSRWNSTCMMLDSALKYQQAFENFQSKDPNYKYCPSVDEWKRGEKICEFLLPLCDTANLISGTSYPTSNLYFLLVWKIQRVLKESLSSEDEVIRSMGERMIKKFEKYWDEYSIVLALGAVLDPRIKFTSLSYCYSKIDDSTCEQKLEHVKRKLYILFEKYSNLSNNASVSNVHTAAPTTSSSLPKALKERNKRMFGELHNSQLASKVGKSQLDIYLDEPNLDFAFYEDLDVLQWWRDNNNRFPDLSIMARDLLSVPITTVASESAFSIGSHVLNKYRSSPLPQNVQALICTRSWLHGFVCDDEDVDDDDARVNASTMEPSFCKGASNIEDDD